MTAFRPFAALRGRSRRERLRGASAPSGRVPRGGGLGVRSRRASGSALRAAADAHMRPLLQPVGRLLAPVTASGRATVVSSVLALALGAAWGWWEAWVIGTILGICFISAVIVTRGHAPLRVSLDLSSSRVTVGQPALGSVSVIHEGTRALPATVLDLPVGRALAHLPLPSLAPGEEHEESFAIPTSRRGCIPVGPLSSVRTDPFRLLRRTRAWTGVIDLYIHPSIVALSHTTLGIIRDTEGAVTQDLSSSDVSFHALRDYIPGDDRRNIHWKTTARTGRLMVRQFEETRRTHLLVVLDLAQEHWRSEEEFECGVSVAASLLVAAMRDQRSVSLVTQDGAPTLSSIDRALDALTLVEARPQADSLSALTHHALGIVPGASVAMLVTGGLTPMRDVYQALSQCPSSMSTLGLRTDEAADSTLHHSGGVRVATVSTLTDLPVLMHRSGS